MHRLDLGFDMLELTHAFQRTQKITQRIECHTRLSFAIVQIGQRTGKFS
jgi:hypothetical protein